MYFARIILVTCALFNVQCLASTLNIPRDRITNKVETSETSAVTFPLLQTRDVSKRPKYKRRPLPKLRHPFKRPKGCTNTELLRNGDFDKNVKGWTVSLGGLSQLFWVKDSKTRPAHSGKGQAYIFLNRGFASIDFSTALPAVEYGNTVAISMWMRYEEPADLSSCFANWVVRGYNGGLTVNLSPKWTKYSFEVPGFGRPEELRFVMSCTGLEAPLTVYMDDVSAKACLPRNPDPECQVLNKSDNLLVNPGFECEDGITAWQIQSNSYGNDSLVQFAAQKGNPTHSGKGMGGFVFDNSQPPGLTGLAIFQWDIVGDTSRASMKASFWLSVDSKFNNVAGCQLSVATRTGYYLYGVDISQLTTKWTKFEIKDIVPDVLDDFTIDISWCTSTKLPIIYIDDVYFGIDRSSPPATPTTSTTPTPTPNPTGPCTSIPTIADPSIELNDNMNNWMQNNGDATVYPDSNSTYGPPHDGQAVAVVQFTTERGSVGLTQYTSGFCANTAYTASAWFYVPTGYNPALCQVRLGVTGASELIRLSRNNVWEKVEFAFYVEQQDVNNPYETFGLGIFCDNTAEMIVLFDDIRYGPAPPCTVTSTIADGGFESGVVPNWDIGGYQGVETITITNVKPRTGKKSAMLNFPSTSNGMSFINNFPACVGRKYSFRVWYYVPKQYKDISCRVSIAAFFTGESYQESITTYDSWTEATLDFVAGGANMTIVWSIVCLNQLQKVTIYVDDVSVSKR